MLTSKATPDATGSSLNADPSDLRRTALLETVLDTLNIGVYLIDAGRLTYVNRKFVATIGYTGEELLARGTIEPLILEEDRAILRDIIARRRGGDLRPARYVIRMCCRNGDVLATEIHSAVAFVDGRPIVIGAVVDVTTLSNEVRQTKEREEYFRALTENGSDLIVIVDAGKKTTYVSPSVQRILGYTPEQLLGQSQMMFIHPEDRQQVFSAFDRLERGEATSVSVIYRLARKDGRWETLETVATNLLDHPHVRGIVLNSRDVTERRRLEHDLEQMNRLTSIGRLAAQVAHEFNNVLMGIQPLVDMMRRQSDDPKMLRFGELVSASISRGKRITTDILRFGRPAQPTLRPVAADELLRQVCDEVRPMMPNGIEVEVSVVGGPPVVMADRGQLVQVLVNLALNARDAMRRDGGILRFRVARCGDGNRRDDRVQFSVMDTGEGIAREDLPYIFEPLFTTKRSGTGLGLSVVFQIVSVHGGHVSVESEPGKGSTFHVIIPAAVDVLDEDEAAKRVRPRITPRVLIVEDDETIAMGLQWALEMEGIELRVVGLGRDVLPSVESFHPDVIVLDVNLPDGDGVSVYEEISAEHDIPVVFSSGQAADPRSQTMIDECRAAFLAKPYQFDELLDAIHELLEQQGNPHGTDRSDRR